MFVIVAAPGVVRHFAGQAERAGLPFRALAVQGGSFSAGIDDEAEDAAMTPLTLRLERTAEALDVSPSSVKRLIRDGRLRAVKIGGATRVRVADLQAYVERLGAEAKDTDTLESESPRP